MPSLQIIIILLLLTFTAHFDICHSTNPDDVHPAILEERRKLQSKAAHFVGKIDVLGTLKYAGTKRGKTRLTNAQILVWNGTIKTTRGLLPTDKPENILPIADLGILPPSCMKPEKHFPTLTGSRISQGPVADGMKQSDFVPCSKHRIMVSIRKTRIGSFGSRRKRSEAGIHPSMFWDTPDKIHAAFDNSVQESQKSTIKAAIRMWESGTCFFFLTLPQRNPNNVSHILFTSKGGPCTSDRLGPTPIAPYATNIDVANCENSVGKIAHAIGHALGLSHSHNRVDRDRYVKIFLHNVGSSWKSQFNIDANSYFNDWDIPYYYDSIMHHSAYAASKNGLMTICPLDPLMEVLMGQREGLSFGDIALANRVYCRESCYARDLLKTQKFQGGDLSRTISDRPCQNWSSQTPHKHKFTTIGSHNNCRNPDGWEGGPWCYTMDPSVPYEPCFSSCEDLSILRYGCPGWCHNGGYHKYSGGQRCSDCICPKHTSGPFCEKLNKSKLYDPMPCSKKSELKKFGDTAILTSRGYPNNYTENRLCMFWIQGPPNSRIKLTVEDFSLEIPDDSGCYDYLEIRPSICAMAIENPDKMRFCGNSLSPSNGTSHQLFSDDNNMVIKFFTDRTENAKGFKLAFEAVPAI